MRSLTDSEKQERERAITLAATRVMAARGFAEMTMDEVAKEAGLAKGTLFLYYKKKEDLLLAVFAAMVEDLHARLLKLASSGLPPGKLLEELVLALLNQFDRRRDITGYSGGMPLSGARRETLRERFAANMQLIASILEFCVSGGLLRLEDPLFAASALFGLCRGSNTYARAAGHRLSVEARAERVLNIFLSGTRRKI